MTTVLELPVEGQSIVPKAFARFPQHAWGLLDGHAFTEWRFDLVLQTHELVEVM
jgi:hypothetical protein